MPERPVRTPGPNARSERPWGGRGRDPRYSLFDSLFDSLFGWENHATPRRAVLGFERFPVQQGKTGNAAGDVTAGDRRLCELAPPPLTPAYRQV